MKYHPSTNLHNKGFTLVELIVSIAVGMLVISIIFSLVIYGINVFRWGEIQNNIQNELRLSSDVIRDNVRYANWIEIINKPETFEASKTYIYSENQSVFIAKNLEVKPILDFSGTDISLHENPFSIINIDPETAIGIESPPGNCIVYNSDIEQFENNDQLLRVNFTGDSAKYNKSFQLSTDIKILNTDTLLGVVIPEGGGGEEEPTEDVPVTNFNITGLTLPKQNQYPDTTLSTSSQYSMESVTWYDFTNGIVFPSSIKFVDNNRYFAEIKLIANSGYTFAGVPENSFMFSENIFVVSNPEGSGKELIVTTNNYVA